MEKDGEKERDRERWRKMESERERDKKRWRGKLRVAVLKCLSYLTLTFKQSSQVGGTDLMIKLPKMWGGRERESEREGEKERWREREKGNYIFLYFCVYLM